MSEIRIKDNESLDSALRRFKRSCAKAGVLSEIRKREHYEKPSVSVKRNLRPQEKGSLNNLFSFIFAYLKEGEGKCPSKTHYFRI